MRIGRDHLADLLGDPAQLQRIRTSGRSEDGKNGFCTLPASPTIERIKSPTVAATTRIL
jgi:hypothetical protein